MSDWQSGGRREFEIGDVRNLGKPPGCFKQNGASFVLAKGYERPISMLDYLARLRGCVRVPMRRKSARSAKGRVHAAQEAKFSA